MGDASLHRRTPPAMDLAMPPPLAGVRALVVEDHDDSRDVLAHWLAHAGARVSVAASARQAFASLANEEVDIIVTDYSMPGDTGLWLLERVLERPKPVPVIVVTGHADLHARELRRAAFARVLRKPVDPDRLCQEIAAVLRDAA
jgi:CheY-like chemotaxis protein